MKYPKLTAAIDDLLSKMVKEQGEDTLNLAVGWFLAQKEAPKEPQPVEVKEVKKDAA